MTTELDYAPPRARFTKKRTRLILLAVTLLAAALAAFLWRFQIETFARQAKLLYQQRQYIAFTASPEQAVYDDDPAHAATLLAQPHYTKLNFGYGPAIVWDHALMHRLWVQGPATTGLGSIGLLFMHERRTPSGEQFILTCELCAAPDNAGVTRPMFQMWEFRPATWHTGIQMRNGLTTMMPSEIEQAMRLGRHVRFFAGQADPGDPTHFTVRYDIEGVEGILDGYEGDRTEDASGVPTPGLRLEVRKPENSREDFR